MNIFRQARLIALALLALTLTPLATIAQESPAASPAASTPAGTTVVATGLVNPRGIAWDANGAMYVAQAGTGENIARHRGVAHRRHRWIVVRRYDGKRRPYRRRLPRRNRQ